MDGSLPSKLAALFTNRVFLVLLTLIIGFDTGILVYPVIFHPKTNTSTIPAKSTIEESKLPISLSLLTNPIVYEWRGSVKGKLIRKDEHSFTLVDDEGNNITITDTLSTGDRFKTMFFDKTNKNKEALLSAIPIGSALLGDFFIFKGGPNTPIGSIFTKQ